MCVCGVFVLLYLAIINFCRRCTQSIYLPIHEQMQDDGVPVIVVASPISPLSSSSSSVSDSATAVSDRVLRIKSYPIFADYEIIIPIVVLGNGNNGNVVQCRSRATGQLCALKILSDTSLARHEVEIHYRVCEFPHIVKMLDVYAVKQVPQDQLYLVTECMEGGDLFDHILARTANSPFTEREAAKIIHEISLGIQYLHSLNIAHRDLKPENLVFSSKDSSVAILKLVDFGFAKEIQADGKLNTPCYTPCYAAPEVLSWQKYDKSCDLWSLGVIMYILLGGYPPFYSKRGLNTSPGMVQRICAGVYDFSDSNWDKVSDQAKELITQLLCIHPADRISIDQLMSHNWIARRTELPETLLTSVQNLSENRTNIAELKNSISMQLEIMRQQSCNGHLLKPMDIVENPLVAKRKLSSSSRC